jgi:hypothetical protein
VDLAPSHLTGWLGNDLGKETWRRMMRIMRRMRVRRLAKLPTTRHTRYHRGCQGPLQAIIFNAYCSKYIYAVYFIIVNFWLHSQFHSVAD